MEKESTQTEPERLTLPQPKALFPSIACAVNLLHVKEDYDIERESKCCIRPYIVEG